MNKLKSIIYFLVLFSAAMGILFLIAGPEKNSSVDNQSASVDQSAAVNLAVDESFFDFGNISMAAGVVVHEFKVKNIGTTEAVISQIYTSCMCTEATFKKGDTKLGPFGMPGHGFVPKIKGAIDVGEEAIIEVAFDPAAHGPAGVGPVDRVVYLVYKDKDKPIELEFKAVVQP
ncbi:MAG TPA: DUF1573 domain-containing protein [Candidatus Paceibacterota bacterium]